MGEWLSDPGELCGVTFPPRPPRSESISALGSIDRSSDDRWFMLASANDRQWPALARAVGMPRLTVADRFETPAARRINAVMLMGILDELIAGKTSAEWRTILDAAGLTFGVIGTVEEIATDPQALEAGILRPLGETGLMAVDSPFTMNGVAQMPVAAAPEYGEHSRAVLLAAGYSD